MSIARALHAGLIAMMSVAALAGLASCSSERDANAGPLPPPGTYLAMARGQVDVEPAGGDQACAVGAEERIRFQPRPGERQIEMRVRKQLRQLDRFGEHHRLAQGLPHRVIGQGEPGAQRAEVQEPRSPSSTRPLATDQQRSNHEQHHERCGNRHQRHQRTQAVAEQHAATERHLQLIAQPRRVKEERPVVCRGRFVEWI